MPSIWKYASASVIGTSHVKNNSECQDFSLSRTLPVPDSEDIFIAVVSDGAGSAPLSHEGSQLACSLFVSKMELFLQSGGSINQITLSIVSDWLEDFQSEILNLSNESGLSPRDYACTFLTAIIGPEDSVFAQIGDGAIVISVPDSPDEYNYVYWPQKGEYENMTFFATDPGANNKLAFGYQKGVIEEVALFSDGLERLALNFTQQEPHAPFFRPMFVPLRSTEVDETGMAQQLSLALQQYLASDKVNDRTDDDKTLILATRRRSSD